MRISSNQLAALQYILSKYIGHSYTDEEAQEAGLAIMRFVLVAELLKKSKKHLEIHKNVKIEET